MAEKTIEIKNVRIIRGIEFYDVVIDGDENMNMEEGGCARCGSSAEFVRCANCGGEGLIDQEDWDYLDEDDVSIVKCGWCDGRRGSWHCVSSPEYCNAHPNPGREDIQSTAMPPEAWADAQ